jgi:hypothetical protein
VVQVLDSRYGVTKLAHYTCTYHALNLSVGTNRGYGSGDDILLREYALNDTGRTLDCLKEATVGSYYVNLARNIIRMRVLNS